MTAALAGVAFAKVLVVVHLGIMGALSGTVGMTSVTTDAPLSFDANGRTMTATGSFCLGDGFSADGAIVVSDQTCLRLVPSRIAGTPKHVLVDIAPGAHADAVASRLSDRLGDEAVQVRTMAKHASRRSLTYP